MGLSPCKVRGEAENAPLLDVTLFGLRSETRFCEEEEEERL